MCALNVCHAILGNLCHSVSSDCKILEDRDSPCVVSFATDRHVNKAIFDL